MNALERQVLRLIGENPDTPDVFADTAIGIKPVRDSICDAIEEVAVLTGGYTESVDLPLQAERGLYRLSWAGGTFAWVRSAWLQGQQRKLERTDLVRLVEMDPRWMVHTGSPESYYQVGTDWIGVAPKPSATDDVLVLTCVVVPAPYEDDGARLKVRAEYERGLVHYAVAEYYASRGDAQRATKHWELYGRHIADALLWPVQPQRRITLRTGREPHWQPQETAK